MTGNTVADKVSRKELNERYHLMSEVKVSSKKFVEMCRYNGIQEKKVKGVDDIPHRRHISEHQQQ